PVGKSEQLGTFWVLAHQLPAQEESWCLACQHLRRSIILSWTLPETPCNLMRVKLRAVPLCLLKSSHRGMTQIARKPTTYFRFSVAITRPTARWLVRNAAAGLKEPRNSSRRFLLPPPCAH